MKYKYKKIRRKIVRDLVPNIKSLERSISGGNIDYVNNIIEYWDALPNTMSVLPGTLNMQRSITYLTNILERSKDVEKKVHSIKQAMYIYNDLLRTKTIQIRLPLSFFFLGHKYTFEKVYKQENVCFVTLMNNKKRLEKYLKKYSTFYDNDTQIDYTRKVLVQQYKKLVLGIDEKDLVRFTSKQSFQFDISTTKLLRFKNSNKTAHKMDIEELVRTLITSVQKHFDDTIHVGHLCSDYTYQQILPKYLHFNKPY